MLPVQFSEDTVLCVPAFVSLFVARTKATMAQSIDEQKRNVRPTNDRSSNLNDSNRGDGG